MIEVPAVVRNKARAVGAEDWLERLPALVSSLEADWSIVLGRPYGGGSEAANALAAPAIAAALFDATGKTARRLPLRPAYIQALLKA